MHCSLIAVLAVLAVKGEAFAEGVAVSLDRSIPFADVLPKKNQSELTLGKRGATFDGRESAPVSAAPSRNLPEITPALKIAEPSAEVPVKSGGAPLDLSYRPEPVVPAAVLASEQNALESKSTGKRLQKVSRIDRLRKIIGSDVLSLPKLPASGTVFSSKVIERLGVEDAASAAISQSYQLAAAESRRAYTEAMTGVARAALLPQVKLTMREGRETTSPANDTYKYAKKDIIDSKDPAGTAVLYKKGAVVPASALLNGGVNSADLTSESFAYNSISVPRRERTLTVSQSLFDYSAWAEVARQNRVAESSEHVARGARLKTVLDSSSSFLKLFQNTLSVRFAEDYENALQSLFERMEERVAAGAGSQADLERVRGRRVNARSTVLDVRNALEVELTAFQKLTGFRPNTLALPPDWILPVPESVELAVSAAAETNPALQADLKQAESILMELRKAKGGFLPQVSLEFSEAASRGTAGSRVPVVTSSGPNYVDSDPSKDINEASTVGESGHLTKRVQSLMLVMNWNLFNGGQDFYQNKAVGEKYNEAMFRLLDTRREMEEKLRASFDSLATTAARTLEIAKEMEANQQVVDTFTDQMFAANRSLLDVLDAHQKLYQSRLDYLRLLIAEANLSYDVLYNIGSLTEALRVPAGAQSPRGLMGSLVGQELWKK